MIYIGMIVVVVVNNPTPPPPPETEESGNSRMDDAKAWLSVEDVPGKGWIARCPQCTWENYYDNKASAGKAVGAHLRHCNLKNVHPSFFGRPMPRKKI